MIIRQHFFITLLFLKLILASNAIAVDISEPSKAMGDSNGTLDYADALIYGLVEGVTEFLPISSTGHLVVVSEFLSSTNRESEEALNAYLIVIQAGAILAVALLYRKQVWSMILGLLGLDPRGKRLAFHILVAFMPAAILGPLLDDKIEEFLFGLLPIAIALFLGAFINALGGEKKKIQRFGNYYGARSDFGGFNFYPIFINRFYAMFCDVAWDKSFYDDYCRWLHCRFTKKESC